MDRDLRCKLFKAGIGAYGPDADEQFNEWMEEIGKEHDIYIRQIDSTQSRHGAHMIFVYYIITVKK